MSRGALHIIDELLANGQCMFGGMADSPCTRLATSRDGYWATCDLHFRRPASDEESDERKQARKASARLAAKTRWQRKG